VLDYLMVATGNGVVTLKRQGDQYVEFSSALHNHPFTAIATNGEDTLAGTPDGIYQSADLGRTWREANQGLSERHVRWLAFHADQKSLVFAGTEPAAIFASEDSGATWRQRPEIAQWRAEYGWNLPYSPAAGCIRGFASHGERVYAAAEQGGLLRSDSRGAFWYLPRGSSGNPARRRKPHEIDPDVHAVTVHPSSPDQVFAATGGGLFYSTDGGGYWERLYACYCRAVWVDPVQPARIILGSADGVDRRGRIEESMDGGANWQPIMSGLDDVWDQHMVERFMQVENELYAVLSNGRLIVADLDALHWWEVLPALESVSSVAWIRR
jgi:photosystem II stability/assembly factor-like uncharacterized protein